MRENGHFHAIRHTMILKASAVTAPILCRNTGWYYRSLHDRAAAWTSVEYFCRFLVNNTGIGPFGKTVVVRQVSAGDVIQLGTDGIFHHSLLVIGVRVGVPYVAAHTSDVYHTPLTAYSYDELRCLKILGARKSS